MRNIIPLHGRTHTPGGSDPIPANLGQQWFNIDDPDYLDTVVASATTPVGIDWPTNPVGDDLIDVSGSPTGVVRQSGLYALNAYILMFHAPDPGKSFQYAFMVDTWPGRGFGDILIGGTGPLGDYPGTSFPHKPLGLTLFIEAGSSFQVAIVRHDAGSDRTFAFNMLVQRFA